MNNSNSITKKIGNKITKMKDNIKTLIKDDSNVSSKSNNFFKKIISYFYFFFESKNIPWTLSIIAFLIITLSSYAGFLFLPDNFLNTFRLFLIPIICFFTFFFLIVIVSRFNDSNNSTFNPENVLYFGFFKYSILFFIIFSSFLLFFFSFYVLKDVIYYSMNYSFFYSLFLTITCLAFLYTSYIEPALRKTNSNSKTFSQKESIFNLFTDIVFYIPCLMISIIEFIKKDYENTPSTSFILGGIIVLSLFIYFVLPIIQNSLHKKKGILLVDKPEYLNQTVLEIDKNDLLLKIDEKQPMYKSKLKKELRQMKDYYQDINTNMNFKIPPMNTNYEDIEFTHPKNEVLTTVGEYCKDDSICKKNPKTTNEIKNQYQNIIYKNVGDISYNSDLSCNDKTISCDSNILKCNESAILKNNKSSNQIPCIPLETMDNGKYIYCKNNSDRETILHDYYKNPILCSIESILEKNEKEHELLEEGFQSLGNHNANVKLSKFMNTLNIVEQKILENIMNANTSVGTKINSLINNPTALKIYITNLIYENQNYMDFMDKIRELQSKIKYNKDLIMGNISQDLGYYFNLNEHIYFYGISFWLYLEPNTITNNNIGKGEIFTFGNRPKLYIDHNTNELVIDIISCSREKENVLCDTRKLYRTNNILYQRWNHVVMNYDYGTLDLFINNNLVGSYKNISPYINDSTDILKIGKKGNDINGGISNFKYHINPLSLPEIKKEYNFYKNKIPPL